MLWVLVLLWVATVAILARRRQITNDDNGFALLQCVSVWLPGSSRALSLEYYFLCLALLSLFDCLPVSYMSLMQILELQWMNEDLILYQTRSCSSSNQMFMIIVNISDNVLNTWFPLPDNLPMKCTSYWSKFWNR